MGGRILTVVALLVKDDTVGSFLRALSFFSLLIMEFVVEGEREVLFFFFDSGVAS